MNSTMVGITTIACIFGGTLVGLALRRVVPADHLSPDSRDAVKVGAGMISMMAALVMGLLVSSAKGTFDSTTQAVVEGGARVILLDRVLANYGPEAQEIRDQLRVGLAAMIELLWPEEGSHLALSTLEKGTVMEKVTQKIRQLKPETEQQRASKVEAMDICAQLLLSRWVQIEQAQTSLPTAFLVILLFWLTMLYMGFGLLAPRNATVVTAMFVGALALATALFLVLEMNKPMAGSIKVSSGPMRKALEFLNR